MTKELLNHIEQLKVSLAGVSEVIKGMDLPTIPEEDKAQFRAMADGLRHDTEKFCDDVKTGKLCEDMERDLKEATDEIEKGFNDFADALSKIFEEDAQSEKTGTEDVTAENTDKTDNV